MGAWVWYIVRMARGVYRKCFYALAVVGVVGVSCLVAWQHARGGKAATPAAAEKAEAPVIGRVILLRPEQVVAAPVVDGFQWPCSAPHGAMIYDAQPFGAMNKKRGGHHTGQDLNGIGGEDTDEGLPICAAGRGLVVYSGAPSAEWGNLVILAHRLPGQEGQVVQTLYAHLKTREARVGEIVSRGERIGTMGTADGAYLAHLHFEAVASLCGEANTHGYHPGGTTNRMNPADLISRYPAPPIPDALESVRRLRREQATQHQPTAPRPQSGAPSADEPLLSI